MSSTPIRFPDGEKFHSFAVDQEDLLEIQGHLAPFLSEQVPKHVHVLLRNPTAYAQNYKMVFTNASVDSAGHSRFRLGRGTNPKRSRSKPHATRNLLKTQKKQYVRSA